MARQKYHRPPVTLPEDRLTTVDVLGHAFRWSDAELAYLEENYASMTVPDIARHLKRTTQSVYYKAHRLGYAGMRNDWTQKEDQTLVNILAKNPRETVENLQKRIPTRTRGAIYNRIYKLGLR